MHSRRKVRDEVRASRPEETDSSPGFGAGIVHLVEISLAANARGEPREVHREPLMCRVGVAPMRAPGSVMDRDLCYAFRRFQAFRGFRVWATACSRESDESPLMQKEPRSEDRPPERSESGQASRGGQDWVTIGILSALAVSVIGLVVLALSVIPEPVPDPAEHARVMVTPREIPDFSLLDHRGQLFDQDRLEGRWSLLFFGYTSCPDICPFVLQGLAKVKRSFNERENSGRGMPDVVFVSVDPQRDSEARLAEYVEFFDPSFTGVSGPDSELQELARAVGAYYDVPAAGGDSYLVNHASKLFLVDPSGRFLALLDDPHDPDEFIDLLAKVQTLGESKP